MRLTYPTVRSVPDGERVYEHDREYEVVTGHRRFDITRKAGLGTIAVRIADLDAWEVVERFIDDHVPIQGGDERYTYGKEEINVHVWKRGDQRPRLRACARLGR